MKINEKNLCAFATSPPYDLEGFLNKKGEVNKAWQRRYFVLKGNLLFYFEKKTDKEPLGVIIVEGCTIELSEDSDQYTFQMIFNGNRTYILSADSQETMEVWMKALTCAGYEYKKLMVAELQRQLEEIEGSLKNIQEPVQSVIPKAPPRRQNPFNRPAPPPPNLNSNSSNGMPTATPGGAPAAATTSQNSINNFNNFNGNGNGASSVSKPSGRSGVSSGHTSQPKATVLNLNSQELSFRAMHEAYRKNIMEDINEFRRHKENSSKPLIEF